MNANELAVLIAQKESGKKEVDIAQISEILAVIKEVYREYVGGRDAIDVPFRLNKFIRTLTDDYNLGLLISQEGDEFEIKFKGKCSHYIKEKQNDTN